MTLVELLTNPYTHKWIDPELNPCEEWHTGSYSLYVFSFMNRHKVTVLYNHGYTVTIYACSTSIFPESKDVIGVKTFDDPQDVVNELFRVKDIQNEYTDIYKKRRASKRRRNKDIKDFCEFD